MSKVPPGSSSEDPPEWWNQLTPQEQEFIRLLTGSGADGRPNPSLEEVGRAFDETRKRIREIEQRALSKLRGKGGDDEPVSQ